MSGTTTKTGAHRGALIGAVFLMATSAIGPGFITQTTDFTVRLGAAFAFVIVLSVLIDIAVQLNVWRIIGVSGMRAQDLGNAVLPGLGYAIAALVVFGGLVFNIANVSGTALGLDAMVGMDAKLGGGLSALLAIGIFLSKRAGVAMDRIVVVLGVLMIALTCYVAVVSDPPVGEALKQAVLPDRVDFLAVTTLIGGTVGGYITYAGAHRLVDAGVTGPERIVEVSRGSVLSLLVTGVMRAVLFLAVLGVVAAGATLGSGNPTAEAFQHAAGEIGLRLFGLIMWAAAITSVVGAAYTSVSFVVTFSPALQRARSWLVVGFIALSTVVFLLLDQAPTTLLVLAGALNGLILPVGFGVLLWVGARRRDLLGGYRYPRWLLVIGVLAWLLSLYFGVNSLGAMAQLWQ
ncbi:MULTISPECIES: NRAMP family divalent metal transporter [Saccharopolyspora]|uniref:Divalent metal cation transporter n=1 Tax=Saccharopolyspora gregorii TaxID=33914 RepID=A0ABP6RW40_9PSEU|nr:MULTISPECIES: NRAMP family divalent metal transporter [Saccharopolyspora]MCA1185198.1 divalent metal cation transporter [Saccharopolyspora sp. 6T]MCA1192575.1 divalent metal cation transporter [Saccharopolyspora sp. 6V]MCA1225289.1 divalent metal cation transporter [Saccharopolyspora sp. 6M]MCA1278919.1 divalent metal cation transporter [Saccharopolyspora sp. 7B]